MHTTTSPRSRSWAYISASLLSLGLVTGCGGGSSAGNDAQYVRWCAKLVEVERAGQFVTENATLRSDALLPDLLAAAPEDVKVASETYVRIQSWMNSQIREKMAAEGEAQFAAVWLDARDRFGLESTLVALLDAPESDAKQIVRVAAELKTVFERRCNA